MRPNPAPRTGENDAMKTRRERKQRGGNKKEEIRREQEGRQEKRGKENEDAGSKLRLNYKNKNKTLSRRKKQQYQAQLSINRTKSSRLKKSIINRHHNATKTARRRVRMQSKKKEEISRERGKRQTRGKERDRGEISTSEKANNNNRNICGTHLIGTLPGDDKETFNIDQNKQNVGAPSNVAEQKRRSVDTSPVLSFPSSLPIDISSTLSSLSLVSSRLPLSLAPLGAVNSRHKTTDEENEPLPTPQKSSLRPPRPPPPLGPPPRTIRMRSDSAVD